MCARGGGCSGGGACVTCICIWTARCRFCSCGSWCGCWCCVGVCWSCSCTCCSACGVWHCGAVGVLATDMAAGVICGVKGSWGSGFGFVIVDAAKARVWLLSRRRFGASLILGCV